MTSDIITQVVPAEAAGLRLDVYLTGCLAGESGAEYSRARVQQLIKDGFVALAGQLSANPAKKVREGEVYTVDVPAIVASTLVAEEIPLKILFEDADLLVLDKPAGLAVHPSPGHDTGTLVHALLHHCGASLSGMNGEARPGIVHRLDKDTSGVMVVAKNDRTHRILGKQFAAHSINREYLAVVQGLPVPAVGKIEGNLARHPYHRKKRAVVREGGKHAVTHYRVVENFGKSAALVACKLETGRTHQIRVHMAHKGHPLLNDPMYGSGGALPGLDEARQGGVKALTAGLEGQALHAALLGFEHPGTGKWLEFTSPLPPAMAGLVDGLRKLVEAVKG